MQKWSISILLVLIAGFGMAQSKATPMSHVVEKGETLYSIGKKYHVTVEALENANKSSLGENYKLKIGQKLTIPASAGNKTEKNDAPVAKPQAKAEPHPAPATASSGPSVHIVAKGETVYAIAKANGLTSKQLKDANHLSDDMKLKLGQKLIIPSRNQEAIYKPIPKEETKPVAKPVAASTEQGRDYLSSESTAVKKEPTPQKAIEPAKPAEPQPVSAPPVKTEKPQEAQQDENPFLPPPAKPAPAVARKNENVGPDDYTSVFNHYTDSGKKKVIYRGIGTFMENENPGNQFLALYNYADMGSILKVTNLMSKEAIYVKVIGKVPSTDTQKDVILKISNEAANKLKVKEDKFLVEVTGYNME